MAHDQNCTGCISASGQAFMMGAAQEQVAAAMCERHYTQSLEIRLAAAEARLSSLCQCRPPRAGQDGYTCPRCEDTGAALYLKASLAAAEARAEKAEGERDQWRESASTNARYNAAWQEWAANVLVAIGKQLDSGQHGDESARCIVEATVKELTAEVVYLRRLRAWRDGMHEAESLRARGSEVSLRDWLAANPEPQPPFGVEP